MAQLPTFNQAETTIGLAGDWHGNDRWAISVLDEMYARGISTVLQLGDFGVWPGKSGQTYLNNIQDVLEENDQFLYVTLGNHEDYTQVHTTLADDDGLKWIRPNIILFPRVFRFEIKLVTFLSLGGAPSIDREFRTPYKSWWPEEMITEEQVQEAIDGGPVHVMLTHDAPTGGTRAVEEIIARGGGWSDQALAYAREGRELLDQVVYSVCPMMLLHGHYHVQDSGYLRCNNRARPSEIHALDMDGKDGNVGLLHIDEDFIFDWMYK